MGYIRWYKYFANSDLGNILKSALSIMKTEGEVWFTKSEKEKKTDDRVNIKLPRDLCKLISQKIREHPEWGIRSISDFVRRAMDNELRIRLGDIDRKVIEIRMNSSPVSPDDILNRDP